MEPEVLGLNPIKSKNNFASVMLTEITREGFSRKNIVAVSFFQSCAIHQYS